MTGSKITKYLIATPIENPRTGKMQWCTWGDEGHDDLAAARIEAKATDGRVAIVKRTEQCVWIHDVE